MVFDGYSIRCDADNTDIERNRLWSHRNERRRKILVQLADQTIRAGGICI